MEQRHSATLRARFGNRIDRSRVHVLDIPDEYQFMDPELLDLLKAKAGWVLERTVDSRLRGTP